MILPVNNNQYVMCKFNYIIQGKVYECTKPQTLEMECEVDEMDAEQTWPTEQDFAEAEEAKKLAKRVPKGHNFVTFYCCLVSCR